MANENRRNIRLGLFVIAGAMLLVLALYFIGNKQNMFGDNFRLLVRFHNVNGLMQGNNVRFAGIDVGTVSRVEIENDTTVLVHLVMEKGVQRFIKKNAIASVGTDGLMGNRLVNINSNPLPAPVVQDGDVLRSLRPLEMDEMVRTLGATNENIRVVTDNLRVITDNISNRNSFWHLLADTTMAKDIRNAVSDIREASHNTSMLTSDARAVAAAIRRGEGVGAMLHDTLLPARLGSMARNLELMSDSARVMTARLTRMVSDIDAGKGSAGQLLKDTALIHNLNRSVLNIDSAAVNFNRNMKALQYSWPFRKGIKKMR